MMIAQKCLKCQKKILCQLQDIEILNNMPLYIIFDFRKKLSKNQGRNRSTLSWILQVLCVWRLPDYFVLPILCVFVRCQGPDLWQGNSPSPWLGKEFCSAVTCTACRLFCVAIPLFAAKGQTHDRATPPPPGWAKSCAVTCTALGGGRRYKGWATRNSLAAVTLARGASSFSLTQIYQQI